jgi:chromosome segregation ATPase
LTWALTAAGAALGILLGWLLRGDRTKGDNAKDWKTRLAARDEDLHAAQQELADTVIRLQELQAAVHRNGNGEDEDLTEARRTMLELGRELESARRALARLGDPASELDAARSEIASLEERILLLEEERATGPPGARIEELEAELATLASMRCPHPGAHRQTATAEPASQETAPLEDRGKKETVTGRTPKA